MSHAKRVVKRSQQEHEMLKKKIVEVIVEHKDITEVLGGREILLGILNGELEVTTKKVSYSPPVRVSRITPASRVTQVDMPL